MKGHKSGLETRIDEQLKAQGIDGEYEQHEVSYTIPATHHTYKPDFKLPNGIFIESKGWFLPEDRKKHLLIKEQNPQMDLRFVLQSPNGKIYKGSKTTYASGVKRTDSNGQRKKYLKNGLKKNKQKISLISQNNFVYLLNFVLNGR